MKRRYYVKIELELHAITCPGVWLCTAGYIEITIKTLGYFFKTGAIEPKFPILLHDIFVMEGYFQSVNSLNELEQILGMENIEISLWQNGKRLAFFNGKLGQIMSNTSNTICYHNLNVQILMKPSHSFPGIIAPKLELTTRAIAQDRNPPINTSISNLYCREVSRSIITPCFSKEIFRNHHQCQSDGMREFRRQKPVCHIKMHQDIRSPFSRNSSHNNCTILVPSSNSRQSSKYSSGGSPNCSINSRSISSTSCPSADLNFVDNRNRNFIKHRIKTPSEDEEFTRNNNICDLRSAEHLDNCNICKMYEKAFRS